LTESDDESVGKAVTLVECTADGKIQDREVDYRDHGYCRDEAAEEFGYFAGVGGEQIEEHVYGDN
jgi:hypothetical protein